MVFRSIAQRVHSEFSITPLTPFLGECSNLRMHMRTIRQKVSEQFRSTLRSQVSRWEAYNLATDVLTHDVHVAPDRERSFEGTAAQTHLLMAEEGVMATP